MKATDFLGQEIKVQDTVVYPNRQGSSLWMNKGTVLEVKQVPPRDPSAPDAHPASQPSFKLKVRREDGVVRPLLCLDRVVVVTQQLNPTTCDAETGSLCS